MKGLQHLIAAAALIAVTYSNAQADFFTHGTVIDTSGNSVSGASIIISSTSGGWQPIDTLTSGTDGNFAQMITYSQNISRIRYTVTKTGYRIAMGREGIENDTANLDTIRLIKEADADSIYVLGLVLDTGKNAIPDAQIIISGGMMGLTILYTLYSGTDGKFAQYVKVTQAYTRIRYLASKDGYLPATAQVNVVRDTADCDTITLIQNTVSINNLVQLNTKLNPNRIALYNLKGQRLYIGSEFNLNKALKNKLSLSQPVIAHYMLNNTVLYQKKILLLK